MRILKSFFKKLLNVKDLAINIGENILDSYITYHVRPKFANQVNLSADTLTVYPKVAIIIQGPLLAKDKFTLNTVRIYKKLFKNYLIII